MKKAYYKLSEIGNPQELLHIANTNKYQIYLYADLVGKWYQINNSGQGIEISSTTVATGLFLLDNREIRRAEITQKNVIFLLHLDDNLYRPLIAGLFPDIDQNSILENLDKIQFVVDSELSAPNNYFDRDDYVVLADSPLLNKQIDYEEKYRLLAEENKHLESKLEIVLDNQNKLPNWRKAFEYESEGLNALYDMIEKYYFDQDGEPIYDIKKLPIKKALESEWLSGRTKDEADTIITSGKRTGKA